MKIDSQHLSRLNPSTRDVLLQSDDERIEYLNDDKWIPYPAAAQVLAKMDRLIKLPKKLRMPGMLIVGEANNGKSSVVSQFCRRYIPTNLDEAIQYPIISVLTPRGPDLDGFYGEILNQLMAPYPSSARTAKKEELVRYYFERVGVRMLIVDEVHHILSGPIAKQKQFMNAIKNLSSHMHIPIVLVGIKDALRAVDTDSQVKSRFPATYLPQWQVNSIDYARLLMSIESLLPLRASSNIFEKKISLEIHRRTNGYIGEILDLINLAAELAIHSGSEKITLKELAECGYEYSNKKLEVY
ncbi:TniB family NTP-binding protein [Sulfuricurvum sp.]|uniref:TniB family NTP-binding protein n=1 Tax=Sulfuricurvum sp. TaxID=2025608 RepID=UPI002E3577B8|nr:TniB family NTP-binding protein [Sulfuricurvum sp.]HEX5330637.1 TniB family NTP-binding protein [Sulfuricurvum sp.]